MKKIAVLSAMLSMLLMAASAQAATITWGPVTSVNFGDPTEVLGSTGGYTYVEAVTVYESANLTINGVTFLRSVGHGLTDHTYTGATHISQHLPGIIVNMGQTPDTGNDYKKMTTTYGDVTTADGAGAITLAGLINDTTYRVQIWTGQWDNDVYATGYDGHLMNPGDFKSP